MTAKGKKKKVLGSKVSEETAEKFSKLMGSAGICKHSDAKIGALRKPKGSGDVHPHPAFG